jgi:hypothetical protein
MRKMAAALGFFCAILLVLMASVPEASAVVPGARGPRGPVKVDRPVGHCGWVRGVGLPLMVIRASRKC